MNIIRINVNIKFECWNISKHREHILSTVSGKKRCQNLFEVFEVSFVDLLECNLDALVVVKRAISSFGFSIVVIFQSKVFDRGEKIACTQTCTYKTYFKLKR